MTRILWSINEIPADPRVWMQVVGQDFWNFFSSHIVSSSHSRDLKPGETQD